MTKSIEYQTPLPADLVFLKPTGSKLEPYTTHEIIADCAGVTRQTVARLIRKHKCDLEEFGLVGFEIRANETTRGIREEKVWHFNEQQATLFITYLQNTAPVRQFKKDLVHAFFSMREELARRKMLRIEGKPVRRSLTDALRDSGEDERMHGHGYAAYTSLAYKLATGKGATQLRKERGVPKNAVAADFLNSAELEIYQKHEAGIAVLLDLGLNYQQIKAALNRKENLT